MFLIILIGVIFSECLNWQDKQHFLFFSLQEICKNLDLWKPLQGEMKQSIPSLMWVLTSCDKTSSLALKRFELRGFKTAPHPLSREWQPRGRPSPSCRLAGRATDTYCHMRPSTGSPNLCGYMQLHDLLSIALCKNLGRFRFFLISSQLCTRGYMVEQRKVWNCHKGWSEVKTKAVTLSSWKNAAFLW